MKLRNRIIALALAASMGILGTGCGDVKSIKCGMLPEYCVAYAVYPERTTMPEYSSSKNYEAYETAYTVWGQEQQTINGTLDEKAVDVNNFAVKSIADMFKNAESSNVVYSPANLYMALAILAECSNGVTRNEVLNALSAGDVEEVRTLAQKLWESNYKDDGYNMCLMANSIWLADDLIYNKDTVDLIKDTYFASSFSGNMGDNGYSQALRDWINGQTKNLLSEESKELAFDDDTAFAIASTIYYQGKWAEEFDAESTYKEKFYVAGDENKAADVDFMHATYDMKTVYFGEKFSAIFMSVENNGYMWLVLPDEGVTPAELAQDDEYQRFSASNGEWDNNGIYKVNLSIPKFDVSCKTDLKDILSKLGIVNAWQEADFSNLVDPSTPTVLSSAEQAVRVTIDEEGIKAAAYTVVMGDCGSAMPEDTKVIDFVLNRPFIFNIVSSNGTILFSGVVNDPVTE